MSTALANDSGPDSVSRLLQQIQKELRRHDDEAERLQQSRWRLGGSLILIGPMAVVVSALQFVPKIGSTGTVMLAAIDAVLLVVALILSFWRVGGSHEDWIRERLRAELLRREYFLLEARVGPYLDSGSLPIRLKDRLEIISRGARDPVDLVPMESESGGHTWREELEMAKSRALPLLPELTASVGRYLEHRVQSQKNWFETRRRQHESRASWFEQIAKAILVAAVLLSFVHLVHVWDKGGASESPGWMTFFEISLPAAGAALVGFQSLMENERLGRSYAYHAEILENFASRLRRLQGTLGREGFGQQEAQLQFMRIVLAVEEMFSGELLQWRLVMQPRTPRAEV